MHPRLTSSMLFAGIAHKDVVECLTCCGAALRRYKKGETIFYQHESPRKLFVLMEGAVSICNDSASGDRLILATLTQSGELFGEVYLFLKGKEYSDYALASSDAEILEIPKDFLFRRCSKNCTHHTLLTRNMLSILADKAYYLTQKVRLISKASLREKLATFFLEHADNNGNIQLSMNREEMADFLGVARPSLSRALMEMQRNGMIAVERKQVHLLDPDALKHIL